MLERLSTMRQDIDNAASRCQNLGSVDNLDQSERPENTPIFKLAEQVNGSLDTAINEVREASLKTWWSWVGDHYRGDYS